MLDVSHNMLRRIEGLEGLARSGLNSWKPRFCIDTGNRVLSAHVELSYFVINSLERLYLVSNKISKIENLECCPMLNMLELGDNKIRKVGWYNSCSIQLMPCLKGRELGEPETSERALSRYFKVDGLSLVLTCNSNHLRQEQDHQDGGNGGIGWSKNTQHTGMVGLGFPVREYFQDIMFQANRIRQIEGLERLTALEELYVADNGLTSMK